MLEDVDLRGCTLIKCDFRYVIFRRATLENATVVDCDFYRAVFEEGWIVADAHFESVSLTHAWLHGMVGMRRATFVGTPGKPALAAEANLEQYQGIRRRAAKVDSGQVLAAEVGSMASDQPRDVGLCQPRHQYADSSSHIRGAPSGGLPGPRARNTLMVVTNRSSAFHASTTS